MKYTCELEINTIVRCRILGFNFAMKVLDVQDNPHDSRTCIITLQESTSNEHDLIMRRDFEWEVLPAEEFKLLTTKM